MPISAAFSKLPHLSFESFEAAIYVFRWKNKRFLTQRDEKTCQFVSKLLTKRTQHDLKKCYFSSGKASLHELVLGGNHHEKHTAAYDKMNGVGQVNQGSLGTRDTRRHSKSMKICFQNGSNVSQEILIFPRKSESPRACGGGQTPSKTYPRR